MSSFRKSRDKKHFFSAVMGSPASFSNVSINDEYFLYFYISVGTLNNKGETFNVFVSHN